MRGELFLLLALSTWRLSSLLSNEEGPFGLFWYIRKLSGAKCPEQGQDGDCEPTNGLSRGVLCEWCNSIWFGSILTIIYAPKPFNSITLLYPLALSASAVIIKHVVQTLGALCEFLVAKR